MEATKIKKIYFASDQHFGPKQKLSAERERHFINWLDMVEKEGQNFFYWETYLTFGLNIKVVPKVLLGSWENWQL